MVRKVAEKELLFLWVVAAWQQRGSRRKVAEGWETLPLPHGCLCRVVGCNPPLKEFPRSARVHMVQSRQVSHRVTV